MSLHWIQIIKTSNDMFEQVHISKEWNNQLT